MTLWVGNVWFYRSVKVFVYNVYIRIYIFIYFSANVKGKCKPEKCIVFFIKYITVSITRVCRHGNRNEVYRNRVFFIRPLRSLPAYRKRNYILPVVPRPTTIIIRKLVIFEVEKKCEMGLWFTGLVRWKNVVVRHGAGNKKRFLFPRHRIKCRFPGEHERRFKGTAPDSCAFRYYAVRSHYMEVHTHTCIVHVSV